MINLLIILCTISLLLNVWLFWLHKTHKKELAQDARELLHYLTHGGAVVSVQVKDPTKLLYYKG